MHSVELYEKKMTKLMGKKCEFQVMDVGDEATMFCVRFRGTLGDTISTFTLHKMPGCCGMIISTGCNVRLEFRNKGVGALLNEFRKAKAREWGYSTMLCTDRTENEHQSKILKKNGWSEVHQFTNARTSNRVSVHIVDVITEDD